MLSLALLSTPGAAQAAPAGKVVAWGCSAIGFDYGQCGVPSGLSGVTAIAANDFHSLALKGDGTVAAWGCEAAFGNWGQCDVPAGLSGVIGIAAGYSHSLAVKDDGTVVAWGCAGGIWGQCTVPGGLSDVIAVAAAGYHSLVLKDDGTVDAWGCANGSEYGQCTEPVGLSGVTAIAANVAHSLALKNDGTVDAWGCGTAFGDSSGDFGQCSEPGGLSGVTAIAAGNAHSLAVRGDGTVVAWGCAGSTNRGQCSVPSGLSGVIAIAAGQYHSLALKGDGTVVAWGCAGGINLGQCSVPSGLCQATVITTGIAHGLALGELCQTISFGALAGKTFGDPDFAVSASASSALPVSFAATGNCAVNGAIVLLTGAGSCTVTASQAGDASYSPAADVSQTFAIAKAGQSITFGPLANKRYGAANFRVRATASSGLPVSFASRGRCTVIGATVHLTGVGSCTVNASQPGDADYTAAAIVSRTFSIAPAQCRVPNVVGKRVASAKLTIAKGRCRTGKVGYAYSLRRKKGIVIAQSRRPGRVLPARSKIDLVVSRGRRR